jgi:hypothetical protein
MKSSLDSRTFNSPLNPLPSRFSHLPLPSQETSSVLSQQALDPRYVASGCPQQSHRFLAIPLSCRGVFTSPLNRHGSSSVVVCLFISGGTCLPSLCLTMNVYSGSAIPAFRRHVRISLFLSPSQRHISWIPPVGLSVCMSIPYLW